MSTSLKEGLKTNSPKSMDSSMKPPGGSVNDGAVRKGLGEAVPVLGPRTA